MSTTPRCFEEIFAVPAVQTNLTPAAVNTRRILTKVTGSNVTAGAVTVTVNLVPVGGTPVLGNVIVPAYTIGAGETFNFPTLIGHVLEQGDFLSVIASAGASINMRVSGSVVTT